MSSPVSVAELLEVLAKVRDIYNAFKDPTNAASVQLTALAHDVETFREILKHHEEIVSDSFGVDQYRKTIKLAEDFIKKYSEVIRTGKISARAFYGTVKYATFKEDETVKSLQAQIARHLQFLTTYHVMRHSTSALHIAQSPSIVTLTTANTDTSQDTQLPDSTNSSNDLPTEELTGAISDQTQNPPSSPSSNRPSTFAAPPVTLEASIIATNGSQSPIPTAEIYDTASPVTTPQRSPKISRRSSRDTNGALVPIFPHRTRPPLDFCTVRILSKYPLFVQRLSHMPMIEETSKGWQIVSYGEDDERKPLYTHQIYSPDKQIPHPYTWHAENQQPLQVSFTDQPELRRHWVSSATASQPLEGCPTYKFGRRKDYMKFQSLVRGHELMAMPYEVNKISKAKGSWLASREHLKIWAAPLAAAPLGYTLSFFCNTEAVGCHMEFPINWFNPKITLGTNNTATIAFTDAIVSGTFYTPVSETPVTRRSTASTILSGLSSISSIHRKDTSSTTLTVPDEFSDTPRPSSRRTSSSSENSMEKRAKNMKKLQIQFMNSSELGRFKDLFERIQQGELISPTWREMNWGTRDSQSTVPGSLSATSSPRSISTVPTSRRTSQRSPFISPTIGPSELATSR